MADNGRLQALLERIDAEVELLHELAERDPEDLVTDPVALRGEVQLCRGHRGRD